MVLLLFLSAALLPGPVCSCLFGSRFLAGGLGGSITHRCFYSTTPANKYERKYWCRIAANGVCYTIIASNSFTSREYRGRVALRDIPQNGTFEVTMTGLRSSDSGAYRCGIGDTNEGLFVSLDLSVRPEAPVSRPTQLIRGELHGSVTVLCPSGDTQGDQTRFWCKVGRSSCTLIASSDGYVGTRYEGRILISPRESSGAFRVLINGLKKEDSGLYLCGTQGPRGQDSPQEVVLQVAAASALPRRSKFLIGTVGGSVSFQCHHGAEGTYERKYLCRWQGGSCPVLLDSQGFVLGSYRGRIRISSSDPGSSSFAVELRQLREEDEGWYWCGASAGHTELTASLGLLIHREICPSRGLGGASLVRPGPAAPSSARDRSTAHVMGTVPKGTTMGTVPKATTTGTATQDTTMGSIPKATTLGTVPRGTTMGSVPKATTTGTATQGSTTLLPTATSATSPGETFEESSSGEPRLLPVVLPVLLLLICVTTLALAKIKLQKQTGGGSTTGTLEAALARAGLSPGREGRTEQSPNPGEEAEFRMGSGKCRTISAVLGNIRMTNFCLPSGEKSLFKTPDEDLSQNLL